MTERVYPVLRNSGFARQAMGSIANVESSKQLVVLPFALNIELLFVVDGDKAMRYVNHADLTAAGLTEQALQELTVRNLSRLPTLKPEALKGVPGLYFMPASDGLGTSRAFDPDLWDKLEGSTGGPIAMAVPTRDWILFTRADQPAYVTALRTIAGRVARGEPYPVSDTVLVREGKGWKSLTAN